MSTPESSRFTGYQWRLFIFLSVATFFEGYDFIALTQILPALSEDMSLSTSEQGYLVSFINLGTVVAYLLVRKADRWGRRTLLTVTIAGYTICSFLSGLAPEVYSFAVAQFLARIFLIAEWAISMVYAAEEFPAARRGTAIGVIAGFSTVGAIVCAGIVPALTAATGTWRSVYFVGIAPLLLLAVARRSIKETARFAQHKQDAGQTSTDLLRIWRSPYRTRVIQLALIWGATYLCSQVSVTFFKTYALAEGGLDDKQIALAIVVASIAAVPLVFLVAPMLDKIGRRPSAAVVFAVSALGCYACYAVDGQWPMTIALIFGISGAAATPTVLNAFTTELFPTDLRGDAFAWSNNLLGRIGYVLSPILVAVAAESYGWGPSVRVTAVFPIVAIVLVYVMLPETSGRELEETSRLS